MDGQKTVTIFAADSFGAETMVDSFKVEVNTPPSMIRDLPDIVLTRAASPANSVGFDAASEAKTAALNATFALDHVKYTLDEYFSLELDTVTITDVTGEDTIATNVADRGDTTCSFTTSPSQPTGRRERKAVAATPADPVAVSAIKADPITATSMAAVYNGRREATVTDNVVIDAGNELNRTLLKNSKLTADGNVTKAMVGVNSSGFNPGANNNDTYATAELGINKDVAAAGLGTFTLTITCEDPDDRVSDSARITVQS